MSKVITLSRTGDFKKTETKLRKFLKLDVESILDRYGQFGVEKLAAATPKRTGKTAASWDYRISHDAGNITLEWINTNMTKWDTPVVYFIVYGHGTRTGGYVPPNDFVTPIMEPLFEALASEIMKEVKS